MHSVQSIIFLQYLNFISRFKLLELDSENKTVMQAYAEGLDIMRKHRAEKVLAAAKIHVENK
jgi:hypothetical protein